MINLSIWLHFYDSSDWTPWWQEHPMWKSSRKVCQLSGYQENVPLGTLGPEGPQRLSQGARECTAKFPDATSRAFISKSTRGSYTHSSANNPVGENISMAFHKNSKRAAEHEHRYSLCGINWVNLVRWLPATQQIIPKHRPQGGSTKENRLRWAVLKPVYINNQEAYHLHINYISLQQQTSSIVMRFLTSTPSQQLVFTAINQFTFFDSISQERPISDNMDITPWLA